MITALSVSIIPKHATICDILSTWNDHERVVGTEYDCSVATVPGSDKVLLSINICRHDRLTWLSNGHMPVAWHHSKTRKSPENRNPAGAMPRPMCLRPWAAIEHVEIPSLEYRDYETENDIVNVTSC